MMEYHLPVDAEQALATGSKIPSMGTEKGAMGSSTTSSTSAVMCGEGIEHPSTQKPGGRSSTQFRAKTGK